MPGGDRTGPGGMGPMTGRAAGFCAGYNMPGFMNSPVGYGRGRGGGRGGGWGRRNMFHATGLTGWQRATFGYGPANLQGGSYSTPNASPMAGEQELEMLKGQAKYLEDMLDGIRKRLDDLASHLKES